MFNRERGDTIVEVLICMAVVGMVLTGAFVSAQRSASGTRQSQERVEALKLAEKQIELIRKVAADPSDPQRIFDTAVAEDAAFCINNDDAKSYVSPYSLSVQSDDFSGYGDSETGCLQQPFGGTSYYVAVLRTNKITTPTFTVSVRWDKAGGGDKQEVSLAYRLYKGN